MEKSCVYHISENSCAYAVGKDTLNVRLKVKANECDKIIVHYKNLYDHTNDYFVEEMSCILQDGRTELYEASICVAQRHFKYCFEIFANGQSEFYSSDGFTDTCDEKKCFYYPVINTDDIIDLPQWAQGGIIYQIIIDRFYDGDSANNPPSVKKTSERPDRNTYYGGDFDGVIHKLDYIYSLGADMIYLSPVFKSPTYHKYDTLDYYTIEDIYGGKEKLMELVDAAHDRGIRIILDAVFNHCSVANPIFQDVVLNSEKSKYSKWFIIDSFPVNIEKCNYDTFAGTVPEMPRFDTSNPEVIAYLTDAAVYWTEQLGIDGWRLDVADEVSHTLWREFRRRIKAVRDDALIIGEVWNQASRWLQGDQFDTVTNYKYRTHMLDFAMGKMDAGTFWNRIQANKMLYGTPFFNYLINFSGSHDTPRSTSLLQDDIIHMLVMIVTLTIEGIPLIYYGDEIAMHGNDDPDNRRAMTWDAIQPDKLEPIKALARFRKTSAVLRSGSVEALNYGGRIIAFRRSLDKESLTVVVNFQNTDANVPGSFNEILFGNGDISKDGLCLNSWDYAIVR